MRELKSCHNFADNGNKFLLSPAFFDKCKTPPVAGFPVCINENPAIVAGFKRGFADEQN